jgi:hypothetical protein
MTYSCFCHIISRLGYSVDASTRRPVTASLVYIRGWEGMIGTNEDKAIISTACKCPINRFVGRLPVHTTVNSSQRGALTEGG